MPPGYHGITVETRKRFAPVGIRKMDEGNDGRARGGSNDTDTTELFRHCRSCRSLRAAGRHVARDDWSMANYWHRQADHNHSPMTTPRKCHFQADIKGLSLPITLTIPIIPDSSHSEDSLGPSPSVIFPDKDSHASVIDAGMGIQQPQDTDTSVTNIEPLKTNSHTKDSDFLGHLSVSMTFRCIFTI